MVVPAQRPCKTQERGLRRDYKGMYRDSFVAAETPMEKRLEERVGLPGGS